MEILAQGEIKNVLEELVAKLRDVLGDNLVGAYLYGSLAMGCFNSVSSDVDIIAVVGERLSNEVKQRLRDGLRLLSKVLPAKGLDISIVTLSTLRNFKYPTPREFYFHYSDDSMDEQTKSGAIYDYALAADFVAIKKWGICLHGESILDIFSDVPKRYYMQSIVRDSELSFNNIQKGPDAGTCPAPVYAVLNFCRTLAYLKEGLILSKKEGGEWGLEHLPDEFKPVIQAAIKEYAQSGSAMEVDGGLLKRFAIYVWSTIKDAHIL